MKSMPAFEGFLKLVVSIPGDAGTCPALVSAARSAK